MAQVDGLQLSIAESLRRIAEDVHQAVKMTGTPSHRSMTMAIVGLDLRSGILEYISAGHPPAVKISGRAELLPIPGGSPMGWGSDVEFGRYKCQLAPRDIILIYSDGLTENRNARGEPLKRRGLLRTVGSASNPAEVTRVLTDAMAKFVMDQNADDIAAICVQWVGSKVDAP